MTERIFETTQCNNMPAYRQGKHDILDLYRSIPMLSIYIYIDLDLVAWHSGRTSDCDRQTFLSHA